MREDLIQSAVSFLTDPKVQSAALAKKISFLESKGMTSEEIEEAMARCNGTTPTAAVAGAVTPANVVPYNTTTSSQPPPVPSRPRYDWRDIFIAAVITGGATYGLWTLAKRLFSPWFTVPSQDQLEQEKKDLDAQFQAVEESLKEIKVQTEKALTTVSSQSDKVNASLVDIEGVLQDLQQGDDARQAEFGKVRDEVDRLKEMVPQLIDRNKQEQNEVLESLQSELKSLKNLFLSRRASTPPVAPEPVSGNGLPSVLDSKLASTGNSSAGSNRVIPAWQMAAGAASSNKPAASSQQHQSVSAEGSSASRSEKNSSIPETS
ncbi:peroxisomal membrane anchor protein conserved region-domain-containing protein [Dichotomocladium elegans]|nr:peroxisomal membrane anchor protein conserved region-domain-containing protein [Dichotomocladium elegans]